MGKIVTKIPDKFVNRGTQCSGYDEWGVPIPDFLADNDGSFSIGAASVEISLGDIGTNNESGISDPVGPNNAPDENDMITKTRY